MALTMDDKTNEALMVRHSKWLPHHTDFQKLQQRIYTPIYRNIWDPEENLIKDKAKFTKLYKWFMKQFEDIGYNKHTDEGMTFGYKIADLEKFLFFFHVSVKEDIGMSEGYECLPVPPEIKFNDLVFRARLTNTAECVPPMEYFEVTS